MSKKNWPTSFKILSENDLLITFLTVIKILTMAPNNPICVILPGYRPPCFYFDISWNIYRFKRGRKLRGQKILPLHWYRDGLPFHKVFLSYWIALMFIRIIFLKLVFRFTLPYIFDEKGNEWNYFYQLCVTMIKLDCNSLYKLK